jgi:hypothetical protein
LSELAQVSASSTPGQLRLPYPHPASKISALPERAKQRGNGRAKMIYQNSGSQ